MGREGLVEGALTAQELDSRFGPGWIPSPRFPKVEVKADGRWTVRPVDDVSASGG